MTVLDVSYANGDINWDEVIAANPDGVWIRASHGDSIDSHFAVNAASASAARQKHGWRGWIGYYHFAEYRADEVFFGPAAAAIHQYKPDRVCVDIEGAIPANVVHWVYARLGASDALSPEATWLYSYEAEANHLVGQFPLRQWWIAHVGDGQGNPGHVPPSYSKYALWQFSWVEHWPGIAGHVDASNIGPGYTSGPSQPSGGPIVADKVLSSPSVNSSWVLRDSGEVDTLRGHAFYGSWLSISAADRTKADVKEFVDFTLRDDGKPGYTIWVLTNAGAVHPYDLPIAK